MKKTTLILLGLLCPTIASAYELEYAFATGDSSRDEQVRQQAINLYTPYSENAVRFGLGLSRTTLEQQGSSAVQLDSVERDFAFLNDYRVFLQGACSVSVGYRLGYGKRREESRHGVARYQDGGWAPVPMTGQARYLTRKGDAWTLAPRISITYALASRLNLALTVEHAI